MAEGIEPEKWHSRRIEVISYLLNTEPHSTGHYTRWRAKPTVCPGIEVTLVYAKEGLPDFVELYNPPKSLGLPPQCGNIRTIGILDILKHFNRSVK